MTKINAVLFDKDGTLLDFHRTWDAAIGIGLRAAAADRPSLEAAASAVGFDLTLDRLAPTSPLIAETNESVARLLEPHVDLRRFATEVETAAEASVAWSEGAVGCVSDLRSREIRTGVVTNDDEAVADRQLAILGGSTLFDVVVGADSGFGAKPGHRIVLAALEQLATVPDDAVMVGDSRLDLTAGRRAGVGCVLITNGNAQDDDVIADADFVVSSLVELVPTLTAAGLV